MVSSWSRQSLRGVPRQYWPGDRPRPARRARGGPGRRDPHHHGRGRLPAQLPRPGRGRHPSGGGQRLQHGRPGPRRGQRLVGLPRPAARAPGGHRRRARDLRGRRHRGCLAAAVTAARGVRGGRPVADPLHLPAGRAAAADLRLAPGAARRRRTARPHLDVAGDDGLRHRDRGVRRLLRGRLRRDDDGRAGPGPGPGVPRRQRAQDAGRDGRQRRGRGDLRRRRGAGLAGDRPAGRRLHRRRLRRVPDRAAATRPRPAAGIVVAGVVAAVAML